MKAIMYHYVRPKCENIPYFKYLDLDNFKRQLDMFQKRYGFVSQDDFLDIFKTKKVPKNGVVLTFDDGLHDHYRYVFHELLERGLWGFFFISANPYQKKRLLNVHRIHLLLGLYGAYNTYEKMCEFLDFNSLKFTSRGNFENRIYLTQKNDEMTKNVKKILNYYLSVEEQSYVLDKMAKKYLIEKINDYYLSINNIKKMNSNGMLVGSHGSSHAVMSKLSKNEQLWELKNSFDFLTNILGNFWSKSYCHPYGGQHSFDENTEYLLKKLNCLFAFSVEQRDISSDDLSSSNMYALPRYDCNQFEFGEVS